MLKRSITSAVILALTLLLLVFSGHIVYPLVLSLLSVTALYEIFKVMKIHKTFIVAIPAYIPAAVLPVAAFFVTPDVVTGFILAIAATIFLYMIYLMGVSVFSKGKISFNRISEVFISVTYVVLSFTSMSLIRYLDTSVGGYQIVLVFLVSWMCDVFAFLIGSAIGKHKLIPEISPKKTIEGSVGGMICATLSFPLYGYILTFIVPGIQVNYLFLMLSGFVMSIVCQIGDLVASLIKREYGAKDYGRIFPGHGGVMDRFDSVLAVSTMLLILCIIFPPFTVA